MWPSLLFLAAPILAAIAAAWGIWRRKWYAFLPAVVIGLAALVPVPLTESLLQRLITFTLYVAPQNLMMTWLLVDAAAVGCLTALWAGWSRAHWFWRLSALAGVPAALSLVKANEPIALAFVVMPTVAAAAWWVRRRHDRRRAAGDVSTTRQKFHFRWPLRDALLSFVVVGLVALAIRSLVAGPFYVSWEGFATLAGALVLLGLSAGCAGGASSALGRWCSAAVCLTLIAAVTAIFIWRDNDALGLGYFFEQPYLGDVAPGLYLTAAIGIPAAIGITSWVYRWRSQTRGQATALLANAFLLLAATALLVPLIIVGVRMLPRTIVARPLPRSETYDKIQAVGQKVTRWRTIPNFNAKPIVAEMAAALADPGNVWFDARELRESELSGRYDLSFHRESMLSHLLDSETAAAEKADLPSEVLELSLLQWRLGRVLRRGGIIIDWHIALRAEKCGRAAVSGVVDKLSDEEGRRALAEVRQSLADRPNVATVLAYDAYWKREWFGWRNEFYRSASALVGENPPLAPTSEESLREADADSLTGWRLLETRLALELYHRRQGSWPEGLADLVPEYLADVPLDPFRNRPLIYRRNRESFTLYSVGQDGLDNGGVFPAHGDPNRRFQNSDIDWDCEHRGQSNTWPRKK